MFHPTVAPKQNASGADTLHITARQRSRIEQLFARDYEIFGY